MYIIPMSGPYLYAAVYALIFNDDGQVLLNQRQNTGYFDGWWTLVAGHIEPGELASHAMIREIKEESNLDVAVNQLLPHHVIHRITPESNGREYMDVSFEILERSGIPTLMEEDKCTALQRHDPHNLPNNIITENKHFIQAYLEHNRGFSELDFRST